MDETQIIAHVREDARMMRTLRTVRDLQLPDWWIAAGFLRNKVWDILHEYHEPTPLNDVDVVYFDERNADEDDDSEWERRLKRIDPSTPWSVKNQARMHLRNGHSPYESATDAMSRWPETALEPCVDQVLFLEFRMICVSDKVFATLGTKDDVSNVFQWECLSHIPEFACIT